MTRKYIDLHLFVSIKKTSFLWSDLNDKSHEEIFEYLRVTHHYMIEINHYMIENENNLENCKVITCDIYQICVCDCLITYKFTQNWRYWCDPHLSQSNETTIDIWFVDHWSDSLSNVHMSRQSFWIRSSMTTTFVSIMSWSLIYIYIYIYVDDQKSLLILRSDTAQ